MTKQQLQAEFEKEMNNHQIIWTSKAMEIAFAFFLSRFPDIVKEVVGEVGEHKMVSKEGCQAFSENCGKKDENDKFICEYCRRWNGQQREVLSSESIQKNSLRQEIITRLNEWGK